jgi:outer membrane protein
MRPLFTLLSALMLSLTLTLPAYAADPLKIAFVNTQRLLDESPQADRVRQILQGEFAPREAELADALKRYKDEEERFNRDGAVMSSENRSKMERDLLGQQREIKRLRDAITEEFNARRNEELTKLQRTLGAAIVELSKSQNYDLILESGVVYASNRADITDLVIERIKRDFTRK